MKHTVREATIADAARLNQLVNSAYRGESSKKGWTTEADFLGGQRIDEDRLREMIEDCDQQILCLCDESSKILSVVNLKFSAAGNDCYLGMLTVEPKAQGAGLGRLLISEAEDYARKKDAKRMTLTVIQVREELMAWYERRGYRKTGKFEDFPYGDIRFGEPKRDDLYFVEFDKAL